MQELARHLYPVDEATRLLGIGRSKLYELIAGGELQAVKVGRKTLVPATSLDRYVAKLTQPADDADA